MRLSVFGMNGWNFPRGSSNSRDKQSRGILPRMKAAYVLLRETRSVCGARRRRFIRPSGGLSSALVGSVNGRDRVRLRRVIEDDDVVPLASGRHTDDHSLIGIVLPELAYSQIRDIRRQPNTLASGGNRPFLPLLQRSKAARVRATTALSRWSGPTKSIAPHARYRPRHASERCWKLSRAADVNLNSSIGASCRPPRCLAASRNMGSIAAFCSNKSRRVWSWPVVPYT